MYIEKRRQVYYVFHDVPESLQASVGVKRLTKSLQTADWNEAKRRKPLIEAQWRSMLERHRSASGDSLARDALFYAEAFKKAGAGERELLAGIIEDKARDIFTTGLTRAGIEDGDDPAALTIPEHDKARRFIDIATGKVEVQLPVRTETHIEAYLDTRPVEPKTRDIFRKNLRRFASAFPETRLVTGDKVQAWIDDLMRQFGLETVGRSKNVSRAYWKWLRARGYVPKEGDPFADVIIPRESSKRLVSRNWEKFTPAEVVALRRSSMTQLDKRSGKPVPDPLLRDLITLAMYTGARIEELCSMKGDKCTIQTLTIDDSKSRAGFRQVPVHPELQPLIGRLLDESKDGYLLSGLTFNKYGDRSNAIGKRFGRLKDSMGFGERHVFHSIRGTVVTMLENAGVTENVAADIVGHDKPRVTYGLYSTGADLETMRRAIVKLSYPQ